MRVLVCGGRDYRDVDHVYEVLDGIEIDTLIHGAAPGADSIAEMWADERGVKVERFPADWERYGRAAGPIRNFQMLFHGKPDFVVAFPGGRGTANMVMQAQRGFVPVHMVGEDKVRKRA